MTYACPVWMAKSGHLKISASRRSIFLYSIPIERSHDRPVGPYLYDIPSQNFEIRTPSPIVIVGRSSYMWSFTGIFIVVCRYLHHRYRYFIYIYMLLIVAGIEPTYTWLRKPVMTIELHPPNSTSAVAQSSLQWAATSTFISSSFNCFWHFSFLTLFSIISYFYYLISRSLWILLVVLLYLKKTR